MKALVYKSTGSWYVVKDRDGNVFQARIKGIFRMDTITSTNPVAVGDEVEIEMENEGEQTVTITEIHPRRNYITRQSPGHRMQHHIVASNLDQSLLFATLKDPRTSQGFIDRFLMTSEAYHIPAFVVFNKTDLFRKKEQAKFDELTGIYKAIGYRVMPMSVVKNEGVEEVKDLLKGKTTLMSGHSGVGKSSFINSIFPELRLKIQDVSGWSGKGLHTTTFAEMFDLPFGGWIIFTPGMREYGIVSISKQEVSHYFPEMKVLIGQCQFNNCLHIDEPGCAIKKALDEGRIHIDRYISYCNIVDSINEKSY
jgi:ribosome biogenesis GTPase